MTISSLSFLKVEHRKKDFLVAIKPLTMKVLFPSTLFSLFIFNTCQSNLEKLQQLIESDNALVGATKTIISNFFVNKTTVTNFVTSLSTRSNLHEGHGLINEIVKSIDGTVNVRIENYSSVLKAVDRRIYNVFVVDGYASTLNILSIMELPTFRFDGFYIVLMVLPSKSIQTEIQIILEAFWKIFIVNVNVIAYKWNQRNEAVLYSYFPYSKNFCGKVNCEVVNEFQNNKFKRGEDFFPQKVKNFYKCPLKVALFEYPPYILMGNRTSIAGTDGLILQELSNQMNFKIDIQLADKELWGSLEANGSSTGAIEMITSRKVHFSIGFYVTTPLRNEFMKSSYTYTVVNLVWIVPPGRAFTAFEKLFKPFDFSTWTFVLAIFVSSAVVIIVLRFSSSKARRLFYGEHNQTAFINMMAIYFGLPNLKVPAKKFARMLLMTFILYCLVIRSAYQSGLFKFLQMASFKPHVESLSEMLDKEFDFYVSEAFSESISHLPALMNK